MLGNVALPKAKTVVVLSGYNGELESCRLYCAYPLTGVTAHRVEIALGFASVAPLGISESVYSKMKKCFFSSFRCSSCVALGTAPYGFRKFSTMYLPLYVSFYILYHISRTKTRCVSKK